MNGREVLKKAEELVYGDRGEGYGPPYEDYLRTTALFANITDICLSPAQGIMFMMCVKLSREIYLHQDDNLVDLVGYVACLADAIEFVKPASFCPDVEEALNGKG